MAKLEIHYDENSEKFLPQIGTSVVVAGNTLEAVQQIVVMEVTEQQKGFSSEDYSLVRIDVCVLKKNIHKRIHQLGSVSMHDGVRF